MTTQEEIKHLKDKVEFYQEWRTALLNETAINYEIRDKIFELTEKIASEGSRLERMIEAEVRLEAEKQNNLEEMKANFENLYNSLIENPPKNEVIIPLFEGIRERKDNWESEEESIKDYKTLKSIIAHIEKEKQAEKAGKGKKESAFQKRLKEAQKKAGQNGAVRKV